MCKYWCSLRLLHLYFAVLLIISYLGRPSPSLAQQDSTPNDKAAISEENRAKEEALTALKLLHENQLSKLYREKVADLQKTTGLTSEGKAIAAFTPAVQATPGVPRERTLLFAQRTDKLPLLFRDQKGDFYSFVFLAKYPTGDFHEEVYLVKEKTAWKIAGLLIRKAL